MPCSSRIKLLVLLTTLFVAKTNSVSNNNNLSTDKWSLTALKSYVTSDPKNIFKNGWSDSTFVCNWTGVTCGTDPLRVVGLNLSYAGLVGSVPPHLGNLSSLVELLLRNNSFHGVLRRELTRLRQLKVLGFGYNDLSGEIPSWLGSLPKLQSLRLNGNRFSGSIPISIFNLTALEIVDLSENQLSGSIPLAVSNATSLKTLDLHSNRLTGTIPDEIGTLLSLETFLVASNVLKGPIPQFVFNMSSLKILALSQNDLFGTLPDSLCQHLPNIEVLYLDENNLSGRIPSRLSECKQVRALSLYRNNFQGDIPKSVANLSRATVIYLDENKLSGTIPDEIGSLHYLEDFQVFANVLKGPIPQSVFNMSSLKVLALSENDLFGTLPDSLCQHLPNIEELYFAGNNLSGRIPSRLLECKQLGVLSLDRNNFQGDIPKSVANLSRATDIYLNENKLSGTIPLTLFNITTIKVIELSMNHLSGRLPPNCGLWLPNLEELYLAINNLSGTLPKSISNASKLTILEVSVNHFSGFIPNTLSALNKLELLHLDSNNLTLSESTDNILYALPSLSHLRVLFLSDNPLRSRLPLSIGSNVSNSLQQLALYNCNLKGHIPATLANFSALILVRLSGNQFSGFIPPSIGMLQKLQGLYLHDNILEGPIPLELCKLQSMYALNLNKNTLSGSIPWCLGHIASLKILSLATNKFNSTIPSTIWGITDILEVDLSSNSLTGSLSTDIGNLKVLTEFNVSNNQLSGNISSSMGYLQSLKSLDLAKNNLQGSIPDSMGNLLSLENLDLSNNRLSGVIPKSFENLSDLTFLNLSLNKLYGEIPSGGPFSKFNAESFIKNDNLCGPLRLKFPLCKSLPRKSHKNLTVKWIIPSVAFVAAILVIVTLLIITFRREKSRNPDSEASLVALRRVSPFELSTATNGFKEENLLGVGGFGSVYKGTLSDGLVVAIKVFNLQLEEAFETFSSECEVLCNVRHKNLVKVITCCSSPDFKALVLQYMPHGSLDKWLYSDGVFLSLLQRLNIMIDVASALEYLHYGYSTPIVHCDLKPSNVLLDENMVAHVADFGIAKLLCGEDSMTQTMTLATIGYMAPEYGVGGVVSRRGDVFSFGVMLMEVFTKKKPIDEMFSEDMNLKQWVQNSIQNESITSDLLRPEEDMEYLVNKNCVTLVLELALSCSASSPEERIDMKVVVSTLNKIKTSFLEMCD